jgi:hypothetical protein
VIVIFILSFKIRNGVVFLYDYVALFYLHANPAASKYCSFALLFAKSGVSPILLTIDSAIDSWRYEAQLDSRFTHPAATYTAMVDPLCPDRLHVQANIPTNGTFKAVYLMWWEKSAQPRAPCNLIFINPPSVPFINYYKD